MAGYPATGSSPGCADVVFTVSEDGTRLALCAALLAVLPSAEHEAVACTTLSPATRGVLLAERFLWCVQVPPPAQSWDAQQRGRVAQRRIRMLSVALLRRSLTGGDPRSEYPLCPADPFFT